MKALALVLLSLTALSFRSPQSLREDAIIGKWMSAENNLEVEVYKTATDFRARILWFDDSDNPREPVQTRRDSKNPDKNLRNRRIAGMDVMYGLTYNSDEEEWQNGHIYDCSSGKEWNVRIRLEKDGSLNVRGYWHFSILGETMFFKRI